ncbi:hypothetical protein QG37_04168 [Candidozyma auris]|uniref:Uncharacterized protein n=1 Tax=Candidozyma auris TaxID=498019 RepID=A0A0L0NYL5_CANAR|nr:hypothetical protein QG37_04168 [[Candida] auris]
MQDEWGVLKRDKPIWKIKYFIQGQMDICDVWSIRWGQTFVAAKVEVS